MEKVGDHHQRNDGRRRSSTNGSGNVGTRDARTTQSDEDASNDMSYDDVCAIAWKGQKAGKGLGNKGPDGAGTWYREKELMNG